METKNRRKFSADFKTKVVLEALKERNTIEEIGRKHELHPNQIHCIPTTNPVHII